MEVLFDDAQLLTDVPHSLGREEPSIGIDTELDDLCLMQGVPATEGVATHATGIGYLLLQFTFHSGCVFLLNSVLQRYEIFTYLAKISAPYCTIVHLITPLRPQRTFAHQRASAMLYLCIVIE